MLFHQIKSLDWYVESFTGLIYELIDKRWTTYFSIIFYQKLDWLIDFLIDSD